MNKLFLIFLIVTSSISNLGNSSFAERPLVLIEIELKIETNLTPRSIREYIFDRMSRDPEVIETGRLVGSDITNIHDGKLSLAYSTDCGVATSLAGELISSYSNPPEISFEPPINISCSEFDGVFR